MTVLDLLPAGEAAEDATEFCREETHRLCACGCGEWAKPGRKYFDYERCRQRAYKQRAKAEAAARGLPTTLSLSAIEAATPGTPTGSRSGYGQDGARAAQKPRKKRGPDMRISYPRAVAAVTDDILREHGDAGCLAGPPRDRAVKRAESVLRPLLPPAARKAAA